jgi:predicted Zn-dependent protease
MNPQNWHTVATSLMNDLSEGEALTLSLTAEDSLFVRMNQAKVRQSSEIQQGSAVLNFSKNSRNLQISVPFSFHPEKDLKACQQALRQCREEVEHLPEDPFLQLPADHGRFHQTMEAKVDRYGLLSRCLDKVQGHDFVGLLTAGEIVRANVNSKGLDQWFETSTFSVDFSLYTHNQQAVKGLYGGRYWKDEDYGTLISQKLGQLEALNHPIKALEKGKYRAYFSPSAVATLVGMLSWQGLGRDAYQQGQCAFKKLVDGEKTLSPHFSVQENFATGEMPRFNEFGEIAPEVFPLIQQGLYRNLLCSSRSAKEYGVSSNFANSQEGLRAPEILPGAIPSGKELDVLGTGLYISDLHYLNWSNVSQGRLTGMTRFGCFWVENGEIIAPVKDLRFDESLYHFWGQGLVDFTDKAISFPQTDTYFQRNLGVVKTPGMLVNDFTFVL